MDRRAFIVCVLVVLVTSATIQCWLSRKKDSQWERIMRSLASPDRSLAWFALSFGFMLLLQQVVGYPHGIVYQLWGNNVRNPIDGAHNPKIVYDWMQKTMIGAYWFLFVCALFAIAALIRGTIREATHKEEVDKTLQDTLTETKGIRTDLTEMKDQMKNSMNDIVKAIQQQGERNANKSDDSDDNKPEL